jgi:hypothetical protein
MQYTDEASEQAPAEDLDSPYSSAESLKEEHQDEEAHPSPDSEQEHKEDVHYDHQEENGATGQPVPSVNESLQAQHRTPSSSSSRVATRLAPEQQEQQETHPTSNESAASVQTHPGEGSLFSLSFFWTRALTRRSGANRCALAG